MSNSLGVDPNPNADLAAAIRDNVTRVIRNADSNDARSLQKAIGPSGYGVECQRRLAYHVFDHPQTNTNVDPWARIVGKAVHQWLADTFLATGETLPDGTPRYRVEQRVSSTGAPTGSCDLLDREFRTVIDFKIPGLTAVREARKANDPGITYRRQCHTYGTGYQAEGEPVDHVAVVMLPKAGTLADAYVWTEPHDPAITAAAIARMENVISTCVALDVETHPERFALIAATPSRMCNYCPWFIAMSDDLGKGCPGNTADLTADGLLMGKAS